MSDPGTPYRTRDEVTNMCSTQDSIQGFRKRILEWGVLTEEEIKGLEKDTRLLVDKVVAEAEENPIPENTADVMFKDIYVLGSEPRWILGRDAQCAGNSLRDPVAHLIEG
jgi:pyruvate dehydrogenase E1 component alpha subunit